MSVVCMGDFGSGNENQKKVADLLKEIITKYNFNIKFILGLGDNIYPDGVTSVKDPQFKEKFEEPYKHLPKRIKFYNVLGNHDYHSKIQPQIEYTNYSPRWVMEDNCYSFTKTLNKQTVGFFAIDTNFNELTSKMKKSQEKKMFNAIQNSKAKWNIVYGHHPYKSTGAHGNAESELATFYKKIIATGKIDIMLSGHDHDQQLICIPNTPYLIVSGTGCETRKVPSIFRNIPDLKFFSEDLGCCVLDFNEIFIEIKFINVRGTVKYTCKLKK
jgi:tartrate-resistant acid phosphatase type 5